METQAALQAMAAQRERILRQVDEAVALTRSKLESHRLPLSRFRWGMVRLLREYQLFKHVEVFDPAIASGSIAQVLAARDLANRCIKVGNDYVRYTRRWAQADIIAQWDEYQPHMHGMAAAIRRQLGEEAVLIEELVRGSRRLRRLSDERFTRADRSNRVSASLAALDAVLKQRSLDPNELVV